MITPKHPFAVSFELGRNDQLTFIRTDEDLYTAELNGSPLMMRVRRRERGIYEEPGAGRHEQPTETAVNIDPILRCLELDARQNSTEKGIELNAIDNWGHFRQNTFLRVSITIADDGIVEIDADVAEQDDSYY